MIDNSPPATNTQGKVSAIILTYNEQENIASCLRSLDWVDDIILVDSRSEDETVAIARKIRPDVRIYENSFEDFGQQRNWALDSTAPKNPWVLFLDADEESTPAFRDAVLEVTSKRDACVGFYLTYRNMFLGRWLKYSTFYPSWQLRLLQQGEVRFRREGHGQREVTDGPLGYVKEPYDHFPFRKGLTHWLSRHNHYSSTESLLLERLRNEPLRLSDMFSRDSLIRRRCAKRMAAHLWCRPAVRLLYTYVLRRGFMDGVPGYIYCRLMAQYEFQLWAKMKEAKYMADERKDE